MIFFVIIDIVVSIKFIGGVSSVQKQALMVTIATRCIFTEQTGTFLEGLFIAVLTDPSRW